MQPAEVIFNLIKARIDRPDPENGLSTLKDAVALVS